MSKLNNINGWSKLVSPFTPYTQTQVARKEVVEDRRDIKTLESQLATKDREIARLRDVLAQQSRAHEAQCRHLHEDWNKERAQLHEDWNKERAQLCSDVRALELEKVNWEYSSKLVAEKQQQIDTRRERIDAGSEIAVEAGLNDLLLELARVLEMHRHRFHNGKTWLQAEIWAVSALNPHSPTLSFDYFKPSL